MRPNHEAGSAPADTTPPFDAAGRDQISHGSPDAWFEFIADCGALARIYADQLVTYASIGDTAGMAYALRELAAATRAAGSGHAALTEEKTRRAARWTPSRHSE